MTRFPWHTSGRRQPQHPPPPAAAPRPHLDAHGCRARDAAAQRPLARPLQGVHQRLLLLSLVDMSRHEGGRRRAGVRRRQRRRAAATGRAALGRRRRIAARKAEAGGQQERGPEARSPLGRLHERLLIQGRRSIQLSGQQPEERHGCGDWLLAVVHARTQA